MDSLNTLHLIFMLAMGAGLGFFGGLFGIGGGLIAVPVFVIGLGMDQSLAQGTALVIMVPNLLIAWWQYNQRHQTPRLIALLIAFSATLTTWLTAKLAMSLDQDILHWVFNVFLLVAGLAMFLKKSAQKNAVAAPIQTFKVPIVGVLGGTSMGLLGMGGGLVATPLVGSWMKQNQTVAQSLSLALVTPSSIMALSTYAHAHRVDWSLGLPLAIGGFVTVSAGVAVAHHLPEKTLRKAFACLMVVVACWLIIKSS